MALLELDDVSFAYDKTPVLRHIRYGFDAGTIYAIVGKSGAGKTTLLSLMSGLASPTEGRILYKGTDIAAINKYDFRRQCVGVVFQSFNLLTNLTALENVQLSMDIAGVKSKNKRAQAMALLDELFSDPGQEAPRDELLAAAQAHYAGRLDGIVMN